MKEQAMILQAGREMLHRSLTVETWGNISVRSPKTGLIFLTPSGMPYDTLQESDIVVLNPDGTVHAGSRKPSVELLLHVRIYQQRPDVSAIIHTHPVDSAVFAVLHQPIPVITDEIAQAIGGPIECAAYALPGTAALADHAVQALGDRQACLLANHGAVCVGRDLAECFKVAAVLESGARIYQQALAIGRPIRISKKNTAYMRDFALHHYGQGK